MWLETRGAQIGRPKGNHDDVRNRSLSISLPHQTAPVDVVALDIGGSLAKAVYFQNGALHFTSVETANLDELLAFLEPLLKEHRPGTVRLAATGGGAFKHYARLQTALGLPTSRADEIECLIKGATFLISEIPNEVYSWDLEAAELSGHDPMRIAERPPEPPYPYMLVNIGSGVGFIKVEGPNEYERVGGSALGGGTLWGLLAMLTPAQSFDEMLHMAARGDNRNVDMSVGDIYGADYPKMGLSAATTASFFAKAFKERGEHDFDPADISRSLLIAISYNIAQLGYLHARHHNLENIYFAGSYIRGHPQTIETISHGIRYWSQGEKTAYFFRHEGYLGAIGALLSASDSEPM